MISKMNGKPLQFVSFVDYDKPRERYQLGRHTSFEAAAAMFKRITSGGHFDYGWMWVEPVSDVGYTLQEVILKSHRSWDAARVRVFKEWEGPNPIISGADCCNSAGAWLLEHQRTTRHFRYWCLEMQPRALGNWPWLREVMAEEVLST